MAPSESPVKKAKGDGSAKKTKETVPAGPDIRNFFGSKPAAKPAATPRGDSKKPITIDDSDEDKEVVKPVVKPIQPVASSSKPKAVVKSNDDEPIELDDTPPPTTKPKASSTQKPTPKAKKEILSDSEDEDIKPKPKVAAKRKAQVISDTEDEEDVKPVKKKPTPSTARKTPVKVETPTAKGKGKAKAIQDDDSDDFMDVDDEPQEEEEEEGEEEIEKVKPKVKPATKPKASAKPKPAATKAKIEAESDEEREEKPKPKSNFAAFKNRSTAPRNPGSKEIPEGSPDCLAGLSFVFTGELDNLSREEAQDLAKRYGGRITSGPSSKTNYVVVGENAGEKKLETIKTTQAKQQADIEKKKAEKAAAKKKERSGAKLTSTEKKKIAEPVDETIIQQITEDDFFNLISSRGSGEMSDKQRKVLEAADEAVKKQALAMEKKEKEDLAEQKRKAKALAGTGVAVKVAPDPSSQLWTTKYAPTTMKEICGNKGFVEKLGQWLTDWPKNYAAHFKKGGKDGMGIFRAVLISGPPGIGKTTSAHLMAKQAGYSPIELNASDARSKKLVENATNIDNMSLDSFFSGGSTAVTSVPGINITSRTCLIMDEVDGMSAGDRGGVGALNTLIKKTKIPIVLICNDPSLPKMKPLHATTFPMKFKRPTVNEVRSRIMSVLYKEKLKVPAPVVDELVKGTGSDIRQVLNMLSTFKLSKKADMDFDEGKQLVAVNTKHAAKNTFTLVTELTGPYAFGKNNRDNLNGKLDLYFQDFSMIGLFIQEHYAKTMPAKLTGSDAKTRDLEHLHLLSKAADSISDGDLVDRLVHGGEQHWSLLPLHGVMSTVRPASLIFGGGNSALGGNSNWAGPAFPQWLGQNSKQTKLSRMLGDIQIRMRLKVSGDKGEIRLNYMPTLASKLILPIMKSGQDAIDDTIESMDEYFLGKDDWDNMVELGVGHMRDDLIIKKIPTAVKTAFTRTFNKRTHPIAFHRAADFAAASAKKIAGGPVPDLEDVAEEESAPEDEVAEVDAGNDADDVGKDKLIKSVKAKAEKAKPKPKAKKEVL